jgi:hypothetical protein
MTVRPIEPILGQEDSPMPSLFTWKSRVHFACQHSKHERQSALPVNGGCQMKKTLSAMLFSCLLSAGMMGCGSSSGSDLVADICEKQASCGYIDASQVSACKKEAKARVDRLSAAQKDALSKCVPLSCYEFATCLVDGGDDTSVDPGSGGNTDSDLVNDACNKMLSCGYMDASEVSGCKSEGNASVGTIPSEEKDALRGCVSKACPEFLSCVASLS